MTTRDQLIDDLRQMEDSLVWLEENKTTVCTWAVLRAVCRAVYHLLNDRIKRMDEERRNKWILRH